MHVKQLLEEIAGIVVGLIAIVVILPVAAALSKPARSVYGIAAGVVLGLFLASRLGLL